MTFQIEHQPTPHYLFSQHTLQHVQDGRSLFKGNKKKITQIE
jgi:hypothetical protein